MTDLLVKYRTLTPDEQRARRLAKAAQPVSKRTNATEPGSRARRIVVTVYPSGRLGLRPERSRREESLDVTAAFCIAVKARVSAERANKRRKK